MSVTPSLSAVSVWRQLNLNLDLATQEPRASPLRFLCSQVTRQVTFVSSETFNTCLRRQQPGVRREGGQWRRGERPLAHMERHPQELGQEEDWQHQGERAAQLITAQLPRACQAAMFVIAGVGPARHSSSFPRHGLAGSLRRSSVSRQGEILLPPQNSECV